MLLIILIGLTVAGCTKSKERVLDGNCEIQNLYCPQVMGVECFTKQMVCNGEVVSRW